MRYRFLTSFVFMLSLAAAAQAQSFGSAAGLLQGEHLARVTALYDAVLSDASDTTAWVAIGTHSAALAGERPYAPSRFTAFVLLDTLGVGNGSAPSLTLKAQVALTDTSVVYENHDLTLELAPGGNPITNLASGQILPVPVYGGGYIRFILTVAEAATVTLDLWRTF